MLIFPAVFMKLSPFLVLDRDDIPETILKTLGSGYDSLARIILNIRFIAQEENLLLNNKIKLQLFKFRCVKNYEVGEKI
ncbi:MAG: hypothetical protein CM1200mP1_11780 [Candidatus Neomarinimicrobiota bacterium]|nr:MAG: hypothetical protein CM1200mP1_11780 [Candidatus Neomarinimicrobiota bacterium]